MHYPAYTPYIPVSIKHNKTLLALVMAPRVNNWDDLAVASEDVNDESNATKKWIEGEIEDHTTSEAQHDVFAREFGISGMKLVCRMLCLDVDPNCPKYRRGIFERMNRVRLRIHCQPDTGTFPE